MKVVLGFFFTLFHRFIFEAARKRGQLQVKAAYKTALNAKPAARGDNGAAQAVQRRPPVPVHFEFRFVSLLWRVLERRGASRAPLVYSSTRHSAKRMFLRCYMVEI